MYTQKGFQAHGKRTTANGAMEGESPGKMYGKSPAKLIDDENSLKETNSANLVTNQSSFAATKQQLHNQLMLQFLLVKQEWLTQTLVEELRPRLG